MFKNAPLLLIGLLSFHGLACSPEPRSPENGGCIGEFPDPGAMAEYCAGTCVNLASDIANCGFCGYACGQGTNACVGGQCLCANLDRTVVSKDACDSPAVCDETGLCLTPDPLGKPCDEVDGHYCPASVPQRICVAGYCTVPDCNHPEICNLLDDNCDGLADQMDVGSPLAKSCYSGPSGTSNVGICLPGKETCVAGNWTPCNGQQTPVPENGFLRCDGVDNDCDACPDNTLNDQGICEPPPLLKADIVFIIDRSGSMSGTLAAVVSAIQSWATNIGTNPNIRFALVNPTEANDPDNVKVDLGLSNYATFNAHMSGVGIGNSGYEPMHFATQLVMGGSFDAELGFTTGAIRIVIAIGDEPTTDTVFPSGNAVPGVNEATVCNSVPSNTILAVIVYPQEYHEWDLCTSDTAMPATAMPLSSDPTMMLDNLNKIIESPCF